ncbi:uncharacterized protein SAPINGB_P002681 [Magnusiomyces paraingens]|uniref:Vacuolar ATPase assembly integral membrane protein VMA21 n=1 Tax=Magnusiomyces paraingens TaxID=2606893 RepID=A0A5E8BHC5_9ASCO|nr:uncharacterized protein SAPINGB_P002681 [Saprochaete ingens]VVT50261.1 unnamed protein product [Saprochaete ingens]
MSEKRIIVPPAVVRKLAIYTAAMVIAPVASFFIVQKVFNASAIVSGGFAALVANIVLIGYVVEAYSEDLPPEEPEAEEKKEK